jgi:quercetin dioxygenase-like cupin family protein
MFFRSLLLSALAISTFLHGEDSTPSSTQSQTHRIPQIENEHVRVWKTVIMPHQPLKMHRHDCPRVVVALKGGALMKIKETGEFSDLVFETGKAYWLDKDPPNTRHADVNQSEEPIEVMVIEIRSLDTSEESEGLR